MYKYIYMCVYFLAYLLRRPRSTDTTGAMSKIITQILVSRSSTKRNQGSVEKRLFTELGQGKSKMNLEHLPVPESKEC